MGKNVLSLFNGISGCHLALDRANIDYGTVYYAEIDKFANKVTEVNYPEDVPLGDVTKWREWDIDWSSIGLITAGFPCQAWSVAGKQLGDKDERGMLFWTTLEIIAHVLKHNPEAKFLMENVKMKKDFEQYITHHTEQALGGVVKTLINSALVSAQNRNRYYWTNFEVTQPEDKGLILSNILEDVVGGRPCERIRDCESGHIANATDIKGVYGKSGKAPTLTTMGGGHREPKVFMCGAIRGRYITDPLNKELGEGVSGRTEQRLEIRKDEKTNTLTTVQKDNVVVYSVKDNSRVGGITENERGFRPHQADVSKSGISELGRILKEGSKTDTLTTSHPPKIALNREISDLMYRKLTPVECERLQNVPDNFTAMLSNTQRYKALGNGWTIDVIAQILECSGLPKNKG